MLDDLSTQSLVLSKEPEAHEIAEAKEIHERWKREANEREEAETAVQYKNVEAWLEAWKLNQEDELDELLSRCHEGSCDWIYENPKIKSWLRQGVDHNVLWLKGKPGSGASHSTLYTSFLRLKRSSSSKQAKVFFVRN